jgi:hypothetical protein
MRRSWSTTLLAIASTASLVGSAVWLAILVRTDAAQHILTHLESGETIAIEFDADDPHRFSSDERAAIAEVARQTLPDVRRVMPATPASLVLRVRSATQDKVIPETGETASNFQPNILAWRVDAGRQEGVAAIARSQLRPTLFHELHHLVRTAPPWWIPRARSACVTNRFARQKPRKQRHRAVDPDGPPVLEPRLGSEEAERLAHERRMARIDQMRRYQTGAAVVDYEHPPWMQGEEYEP